jgi:hypothetical protein
LDQKRRFDRLPFTSGLLPSTDIVGVRRHVANVPIEDPCTTANKSLFNYLVGGSEIDLSQCWVGDCRQSCASLPHGGRAPVSTGERIKQSREGRMTVAGQAFLFTGELFLLSFAAIFVIWFADRLRRNFIGKP